MAAIFAVANAASSLLNPWGLSLSLWVGAFVCFRLVLLVGIEGTVSLLGQLLPKLPTRTGDKAPYQHPLGRLDFTYLAINSCIEFTFTNQLIRLLWFSPIISRAPATLGVLNSAGESSCFRHTPLLPAVTPHVFSGAHSRMLFASHHVPSLSLPQPPKLQSRSGSSSSSTTCCTRQHTA